MRCVSDDIVRIISFALSMAFKLLLLLSSSRKRCVARGAIAWRVEDALRLLCPADAVISALPAVGVEAARKDARR